MTQLAYTAIDYMPLERPNSWHHPTGYGTLGYALPAAIGGAIADPGRPILVVVGDAGLQYTMQELPLAVELGLNIKILLWNNDALEQIRDDMVAAGISPTAVVQRNPDFSLLAQACGWEYGRVDSLEKLENSLARAFTHQGPYLLQVNEKNIFPGPGPGPHFSSG
jgi:acetolactate synthase-1/2/3 large subunit/5-guanidino-2-oxopentanoate decarboxylase